MNPTPKTDEIDAYFGMPTDPAALAYRKLCRELEAELGALRRDGLPVASQQPADDWSNISCDAKWHYVGQAPS